MKTLSLIVLPNLKLVNPSLNYLYPSDLNIKYHTHLYHRQHSGNPVGKRTERSESHLPTEKWVLQSRR